ncbi:MAG: TolC family protein [Bacteroidales bacterium]
MKRFTGILLIFLVITLAGNAQELWTLDDCIEHAMENNIQLKRQELLSENAHNNFKSSLISVLPSLTAFSNHDLNSGRALNYDTYQWENREFEQGNLGIESRVNLFSGFQNYNNIKQHRFMLMSRLEENERTMNDISLNISAAYFEILLDMELVDIAEKQLEISNLEMEAARSNFRVGNISRGQVLEIESQAAADEYQLTLARNNLSQSYLNLFQILQLEPGDDFQIKRPETIEINESAIVNSVDNIYDEAQTILPQVRGAEYFLKSRESELAMTQGLQSPRLSLRGLFYSRYSELAVDPLNGGDYSYSQQIKDNQYRQLGISLVIPILDGWNVRNRISNAKISVMDASYQLDETRQNLFSEIHQMHNNARNAYNRYNSASKAVMHARETSEYAREQFRMGMINFVDYQHAQTSLFRAQSNMAQAKYEFYLRSMILDFYIGEPLGLQ